MVSISPLLVILMIVKLELSSPENHNKRLLLHGDQDVLSEFHRISTLVDQLMKEKNESDNKLRATTALVQQLVKEKNQTDNKLNMLEEYTKQIMKKDNMTDARIRVLETSLKQLQIRTDGERSTYVRWGRSDCPGNGTSLIYSGYVGGSDFNQKSGAANYVCLSEHPTWGHYDDTVNAGGKMYGTEYQFEGESSNAAALFGRNLLDDDAPCAVCASTRPTSIMIPGRNKCTAGWTEEYHGYLVSGHYSHASSEYVCLDVRPDVVVGGGQNHNGHLFYMVEGICGSFECPPYVNGRELTCVVCTK